MKGERVTVLHVMKKHMNLTQKDYCSFSYLYFLRILLSKKTDEDTICFCLPILSDHN